MTVLLMVSLLNLPAQKKVQSKYFPKLCTKAFHSPYQTYYVTLDHFKIPLAMYYKAET